MKILNFYTISYYVFNNLKKYEFGINLYVEKRKKKNLIRWRFFPHRYTHTYALLSYIGLVFFVSF